jgi:hypothetical protein
MLVTTRSSPKDSEGKREGEGKVEIAYELENVTHCFWRDHLQWI